jgi:NADPH:quinone reductase-like Zn-dependent oxidoreductase
VPGTMRAVVAESYGPPSALIISETAQPDMQPGRILVSVHASSLNPLDWHGITGQPWLVRLPRNLRRRSSPVCGTDFAGVVTAVADDVTQWRVGDRVFGAAGGAWAEVVVAKAGSLSRIPSGATFEEAASIPIAGVSALQALRDKGRVCSGQRVLINGASGGVGTFAVQIARHMGAHVTAVCSTRNVEVVRGLGADRVVDYSSEQVTDVAAIEGRFDVIIDSVGNHSLAACRRMLSPRGVYVVVGGPKRNRAFGPIGRMIRAVVRFSIARQSAAPFLAKVNKNDLDELGKLLASGAIRPVLSRTIKLEDIPTALDELSGGHTQGKIVVRVDQPTTPSGQPTPQPPDL